MNSIIKENLREDLIKTINSYAPEWIDQCDNADVVLSALLYSIEEFEDVNNEAQYLEREKWQRLEDQNKG